LISDQKRVVRNGEQQMNDQSKIIDESGAEVLDPRTTLSESTLAVDLARIEIDQQIATAHRFKRVLDEVIKNISTLACYNKESAENCIYALPRGGKPIIGPSIGFANIVGQAWGNCRMAARIVYIDVKQKVVIAEGAFLDLQTNSQSIVPVQRRIVDSKGRLYSDDMQIVTGMAAASIARRNAILQGVPRGIWHPLWMDALGIVRGTVQTFAENKGAAFKALAQFGVKPEQVIMLLGLKGEADLTFEHLPTMRGIYSALRDGSVTVEEMFDPRRMTGRGFETVANPLADAPADDLTGGMGEATAGPEGEGEGAPVAAKADPGPAKEQASPKAAEAPAAAQASPQETSAQHQPDLLKPDQGASAAQGTASVAQPSTATPKTKAPTNAAEYIDHWRAACAGATSMTQVKNLHSQERGLRKSCEPFDEDQHDEIRKIRDERIAQLGGK
jgi:hypothetical protein